MQYLDTDRYPQSGPMMAWDTMAVLMAGYESSENDSQFVDLSDTIQGRAFTPEEYQALDMPYCHLLPFTEAHQWEQHTRHYDFYSAEWEEWCDYVARAHCAELSDDPNLIGYFYSDCPTWIHDRLRTIRQIDEAIRRNLHRLTKAFC